MARTGESIVKQAVKDYLTMVGCITAGKAALATQAHTGWYFMPVGGYMSGVSGIPDFIGHIRGHFFSVETKVEKKNPTPLQQHQINAINLSGGKAFVVRGVNDLEEFKEWVKKCL